MEPHPGDEHSGAPAGTRPRALCGIVLLDKPVGLSSNAALQRVRRLAGGVKAGHTGSLDPLASGMLPICLGEATKFAGEVLALRKAYRFTLRLGERSSTGDAEGEIVERQPVPPLTPERIDAALRSLTGEQQQVPPMYSALKRNGQPLYRLAREGLEVPREARRIVIETLELSGASEDRLELSVLCSKGTYVRVLGETIARALGSCGHLIALRREYAEPFEDEPVVALEELGARLAAGAPWPLLPPDRGLLHLPALSLNRAAVRELRFGRPLSGVPAVPGSGAGIWRLYQTDIEVSGPVSGPVPVEAGSSGIPGGFIGLGQSDAGGLLRVRRLLQAD